MDEDKKLNEKPVDESAEKRGENRGEKKAEKGDRSLGSKLGDYRGEYKKIIWPTRQELVKETVVVIITCLMIGAVITSFDTLFSNGYNLLVDLLKPIV